MLLNFTPNDFFMGKMSPILKLLKNKYLLSSIVFLVWICFFDRNDMFTQRDRKIELEKLEITTEYYQGQIEQTKKDLSDLERNPAALEKFARENYLLKRPNEDIFIVEDFSEKKIK